MVGQVLFTFLLVVLRGKEERKGEDAGARGRPCLWLWGLASSHWLAYFPPLFVFLIFWSALSGWSARGRRRPCFLRARSAHWLAVFCFFPLLFTLLFPVGYRPATGRPSQAGRASARGRKGKVLLCFASLVVVPIGRPSFCRRPNQQRASLRNWAGPGCALPQPIAIGCPPSLHAQTINSFKHPSISAILPNTSSTTTSTRSTQDDKPQPPQPPCRLHVSNCAQPCR